VKLAIAYQDEFGEATKRVVWPFALGYFERVQIVIAWCELRQGYRHFRADRISRCEALKDRYPRKRAVLLAHWQETEGRRREA
jgi:predicted DNA-binding transcriptional regulator YafY